MKKQLIGICVCLLLIGTVLPAMGTFDDEQTITDWTDSIRLPIGGGRFGRSVAIDGDFAVVQSTEGAVMFHYDGENWSEYQQLTTSSSSYDHPHSVAIDGDYAIIFHRTTWYAYRYNGSHWNYESTLYGMGRAVSISGNTALVGARVYERDDDGWEEITVLVPSDSRSPHYYGDAVSIDGDYAVIGDSSSNLAYVFERQNDEWTEVARLTEPFGRDIRFGYSVAIEGNDALIGAIEPGSCKTCGGEIFFYRRQTDGEWVYLGRFASGETGSLTGCSLTMKGNYAIAGGYGDELAIILKRNDDGEWYYNRTIGSPASYYARFGYSVGIDDDHVIIGAPLDDYYGEDTGSAFIYNLYPPCPYDVNSDGWVNTLDVGLVMAAYGQDPSNPEYSVYDVNDDGAIDTIDSGLVRAAYGPCS